MGKIAGKIANFAAGFMLALFMAIILFGNIIYVVRGLLDMGC